jgi:hypothetical protein
MLHEERRQCHACLLNVHDGACFIQMVAFSAIKRKEAQWAIRR